MIEADSHVCDIDFNYWYCASKNEKVAKKLIEGATSMVEKYC